MLKVSDVISVTGIKKRHSNRTLNKEMIADDCTQVLDRRVVVYRPPEKLNMGSMIVHRNRLREESTNKYPISHFKPFQGALSSAESMVQGKQPGRLLVAGKKELKQDNQHEPLLH
jgi:hypothetical protein